MVCATTVTYQVMLSRGRFAAVELPEYTRRSPPVTFCRMTTRSLVACTQSPRPTTACTCGANDGEFLNPVPRLLAVQFVLVAVRVRALMLFAVVANAAGLLPSSQKMLSFGSS